MKQQLATCDRSPVGHYFWFIVGISLSGWAFIYLVADWTVDIFKWQGWWH